MDLNKSLLSDKAVYWNNKHPKSDIVYAGRATRLCPTRIPIDVRRMVWNDDCILKTIIKDNSLNKTTYDDSAMECQKFVVKVLKYIGDKESSGIEEYWQFPNETVATKSSDCEDGAIFMASLILNCGVPSWRVRVAAGLVQPSPTAKTGGHAYVCYCRESDNNWVILDWCYYEDSAIPMNRKPLSNSVKTYKEVWFSFNNEFSWSHSSFDIISSIKTKPKTIRKNKLIDILKRIRKGIKSDS